VGIKEGEEIFVCIGRKVNQCLGIVEIESLA
jgi:hypothetical protein